MSDALTGKTNKKAHLVNLASILTWLVTAAETHLSPARHDFGAVRAASLLLPVAEECRSKAA